MYFNSLYTSDFCFYGQSFYKKTLTKVNSKVKVVYKKRVPKNIHRFLTARALAYWYMDDGALKWKGKVNSFVFCTESFSKSDVLLLKSALERNFNLKLSLQRKSAAQPLKDNFRLYVSTESSLVFKDLVRPYIHSSMLYKLDYDEVNKTP